MAMNFSSSKRGKDVEIISLTFKFCLKFEEQWQAKLNNWKPNVTLNLRSRKLRQEF